MGLPRKKQLLLIFLFLLLLSAGYIGAKQGLIFTNKIGYKLYSQHIFPQALSYKHNEDAEYVITKPGKIFRVKDQESTLFQDLTDRIYDNGTEDGLLSIEFHPNFDSNHFVFLFFTEINQTNGTSLQSTLSRFTLSEDNMTLKEEVRVLELPLGAPWHRGGNIEFGRDGFLYITTGDNAASDRSQRIDNLYGKILRIDVDHFSTNKNYSIPTDNPFVNNVDTRREIWAYGLRNPWRAKIYQDIIWVGDVGQDDFEEIDVVHGGENFGWPVFEGFECKSTNITLCDGKYYTAPIIAYPHEDTNNLDDPHGISVIAGTVYRGSKFPTLRGKFIFSDYLGRTYALKFDPDTYKALAIDFLLRFPSLIVDIQPTEDNELVFMGIQFGMLYTFDNKGVVIAVFSFIVLILIIIIIRRKRGHSV